MLRSYQLFAAASLAAALVLPAQAATAPAPVRSLVNTVITASNVSNPDMLARLYTNDAIVVDENPPYAWRGVNAGRTWLIGVDEITKHMKQFNAAAQAPTEYRSAGNDAYVVVPVVLTASTGAKRFRETGMLTFTLHRIAGAWKISSQVWTTATRSDR